MATPQNLYLACLLRLLAVALFTAGSTAAQPQEPDPTDAPEALDTAPTPAPEVVVPDVQQQQLDLLATELADENLVWLTAGDDRFPALWQPDSSGNPFGAVLLVHGAGQNVDWPSTIKQLRATLGDFGWATLSISLPDPAAPAPPPRPEPTAPAPQTEQPNDTSPVERVVAARMKAATEYLNSKGQYNIVFAGEGVGAARVTRYLQSISQEFPAKLNEQRVSNKRSKAIIRRPIRALILVNARNQIPFDSETEDKKIFDWLNDAGLPVLDIYFGNHFLDEFEPSERKKAARRLRMEHYNQVSLVESQSQSSTGETQLSRRVRGFLAKYAKGVELEGAR